jgi:hypothetical protein
MLACMLFALLFFPYLAFVKMDGYFPTGSQPYPPSTFQSLAIQCLPACEIYRVRSAFPISRLPAATEWRLCGEPLSELRNKYQKRRANEKAPIAGLQRGNIKFRAPACIKP